MDPATPNHPIARRGTDNKLIALAVAFLAAAATAAAVWLLWPAPKWVTRAKLHLAERPDEGSSFQRFRQAQATLIKSRMVLNSALNRPDVKSLPFLKEEVDPTGRLEREIKVDFPEDEEVLQISLEGSESKTLETIVNAIARVYLEEVVNREYSQRKIRQTQLEGTVRNLDLKIHNKRNQLENLVRLSGVNSTQVVSFQQKFTAKSIESLIQELVQLRSELRKVQTRILVAEEKDQSWSWAAVVYALPNLSTPVNLAIPTLLLRTRQGSTDNLRRLKTEQTYLRQLEALLEKDIAVLTKEKHDLGTNALNLDEFRADIARWEANAKKLSDEIDRLEGEARVPPRVSLLEDAVSSQADNVGRRMWLSCLAALGTAVLVLLFFAWWRY